MTREERQPKPELLEIRWVCSVCMKVIYEKLNLSWAWHCDHRTTGRADTKSWQFWQPIHVEGPRCHGLDMLILGEPKLDVHGLRGRGLIIDPLDDMYCPKAEVA